MKISKIKIQNFKQFKDFEIDLTYPQGYKKAGQPLDKVCIIGQNGIGKTTLLNLIDDFYLNYLVFSTCKSEHTKIPTKLNFYLKKLM